MLALPYRKTLLYAGALLAAQAGILLLMGQPVMCACGYVKLWEGSVLGSGNSQQLLDWYSFTHIIHGFIFYAFLRFVFPRMPAAQRLLLALGIEVSWELIENSYWVIHFYRQQALSQGYAGDSIINSLSDSVSMLLGFVLAWRLPAWTIVLLAVGIEMGLALLIRDNLTLNLLGFVHQFTFIQVWQAGAL